MSTNKFVILILQPCEQIKNQGSNLAKWWMIKVRWFKEVLSEPRSFQRREMLEKGKVLYDQGW